MVSGQTSFSMVHLSNNSVSGDLGGAPVSQAFKRLFSHKGAKETQLVLLAPLPLLYNQHYGVYLMVVIHGKATNSISLVHLSGIDNAIGPIGTLLPYLLGSGTLHDSHHNLCYHKLAVGPDLVLNSGGLSLVLMDYWRLGCGSYNCSCGDLLKTERSLLQAKVQTGGPSGTSERDN